MGNKVILKNSKIGSYYCSTDIEVSDATFNKLEKLLLEKESSIILCPSFIEIEEVILFFGLPVSTICSNYYYLEQISNIRNGDNYSFIPMLAFTKEKMDINKVYASIYENAKEFDQLNISGIKRIHTISVSLNISKKITKNVKLENCEEFFLEQVLMSRNEKNKINKIRKHYYFYVTKGFVTMTIINNEYVNLLAKVKENIDVKLNRKREIKK